MEKKIDNKMKVWECKKCGGEDPCIIFDPSGELRPDRCPAKKESTCMCYWHETTRYEITERKPDYAGMAERRQFGKFGLHNYGYLYDYSESDDLPFAKLSSKHHENIDGYFGSFTPCSEPVELDDITMEPKK